MSSIERAGEALHQGPLLQGELTPPGASRSYTPRRALSLGLPSWRQTHLLHEISIAQDSRLHSKPPLICHRSYWPWRGEPVNMSNSSSKDTSFSSLARASRTSHTLTTYIEAVPNFILSENRLDTPQNTNTNHINKSKHPCTGTGHGTACHPS